VAGWPWSRRCDKGSSRRARFAFGGAGADSEGPRPTNLEWTTGPVARSAGDRTRGGVTIGEDPRGLATLRALNLGPTAFRAEHRRRGGPKTRTHSPSRNGHPHWCATEVDHRDRAFVKDPPLTWPVRRRRPPWSNPIILFLGVEVPGCTAVLARDLRQGPVRGKGGLRRRRDWSPLRWPTTWSVSPGRLPHRSPKTGPRAVARTRSASRASRGGGYDSSTPGRWSTRSSRRAAAVGSKRPVEMPCTAGSGVWGGPSRAPGGGERPAGRAGTSLFCLSARQRRPGTPGHSRKGIWHPRPDTGMCLA